MNIVLATVLERTMRRHTVDWGAPVGRAAFLTERL
jgi:hypothetical protein